MLPITLPGLVLIKRLRGIIAQGTRRQLQEPTDDGWTPIQNQPRKAPLKPDEAWQQIRSSLFIIYILYIRNAQ